MKIGLYTCNYLDRDPPFHSYIKINKLNNLKSSLKLIELLIFFLKIVFKFSFKETIAYMK